MKIIDINQWKANRLVNGKSGVLRKSSDFYEYCFIDDYEEKFAEVKTHGIQIGDFYAILLETKSKPILVSLQFPISEDVNSYDIERIVTVLDQYVFSFNEKDEKGFFATEAAEVVEGILFKGMPLVMCRRGKEKLYYDITGFEEVTDAYFHFHRIMNTADFEAADLEDVQQQLTIIYNGQVVREVPRIEFDVSKDYILYNGLFIVADYLDDYCGNIGFYRASDPLTPIAYLLDDRNPIFLTIEELADGSKICVAKQKEVDLERIIPDLKKGELDE